MTGQRLYYLAAAFIGVGLLAYRWHVVAGIAFICGGLALISAVMARLQDGLPRGFPRTMFAVGLVLGGVVFLVLGVAVAV